MVHSGSTIAIKRQGLELIISSCRLELGAWQALEFLFSSIFRYVQSGVKAKKIVVSEAVSSYKGSSYRDSTVQGETELEGEGLGYEEERSRGHVTLA